VDERFEEKKIKREEQGTSTKCTVLGSIKTPKGKAYHSPGEGQVEGERNKFKEFSTACAVRCGLSKSMYPSFSAGALGSLGLGAVGGRVRAPGDKGSGEHLLGDAGTMERI
jgi:hypothetical protein